MSLNDLAERFLEWLEANGRGVGHLTWRVLEQLGRGAPPADAARIVWEAEGREDAGNGAVMRCSPVALRWRSDPATLVHETLVSAQVTHYDPRCQWSAVAVNVALANALEQRPVGLQALVAALEKAGAPPWWATPFV